MERKIDDLLNVVSTGQSKNIHFLDLENLAGSGLLMEETVSEVRATYFDAVGASESDIFIVAAGTQNRIPVRNGWPKAIYKFKPGKDGADQALVYLFEQIESLESYNHLFLGSGDAGLLSIVENAQSKNVAVTVIANKGCYSRRYKKFEVIEIERGRP